MVFPAPGVRLVLLSIPSALRGEIIHLLGQVRQLDQAFPQVLLKLGHLQLQGQDSLTKHTNIVSIQTK